MAKIAMGHEDKPRCIDIIVSQSLPGAALAARLKLFHDSWKVSNRMSPMILIPPAVGAQPMRKKLLYNIYCHWKSKLSFLFFGFFAL